MKFSVLKNTSVAFLALSLTSVGFATPDLDWGSLDGYFNVNTLTPGPVVNDNTPDTDYKFDVDGAAESGLPALVDALETEISDDGFTMLTKWSPAGSVVINSVYLKAGNFYILWDTSSVDWSIYSGLYFTNDVIVNPNGKTHPLLGISHESLNGYTVPPPSVPDSGTSAILVGLGLISLGLFRRKLV
jgi:hypothetical protein